MRFRIVPVLCVFAAGLVSALLPRGAFGGRDIAGRAAIAAVVALVTGLMLTPLARRWKHSRS